MTKCQVGSWNRKDIREMLIKYEVLNLVTGNVPMLVVTHTVAIKMSTGKLGEVCIQEFYS